MKPGIILCSVGGTHEAQIYPCVHRVAGRTFYTRVRLCALYRDASLPVLAGIPVFVNVRKEEFYFNF